MLRPILVLATLVAPLHAQHVLSQYTDPTNTIRYDAVRPAGDVDLDGVGDFVVFESDCCEPSAGSVVSGATGAEIWSFSDILLDGPRDAVGIGDLDGDLRSDIVFVGGVRLRILSGLDGSVLYARNRVQGLLSVEAVGDFNGNGTPDYAVARYRGGTDDVRIRDGVTDEILLDLDGFSDNDADSVLRTVGDVAGDSRPDLALQTNTDVFVIRTSPAGVERTIPFTGADAFATIDLDGDGRRELFVGQRDGFTGTGGFGRVFVYDALTGAEQFVLSFASGETGFISKSMASVGDLNLDGTNDFVVSAERTPSDPAEVLAVCGASRRVLWRLRDFPGMEGIGSGMLGIGDVDGDGFDDLAIAASGVFQSSGYMRVSGKVLANNRVAGSACGMQTFPPALGSTPWQLGLPVSIECRDGVAGATGVLAFSGRPQAAGFLGAGSCFAAFDMFAWNSLFVSPLSAWTFGFTLPMIPQLAGAEVAMQVLYVPTPNPIGFDLSNGLWVRIGY